MSFKKLILLGISLLLVACNVDELYGRYRAYYVDADKDGLTDIYIKYYPPILIITGDIDIPITYDTAHADYFMKGYGVGVNYDEPVVWSGTTVNVSNAPEMKTLKIRSVGGDTTQFVIQALTENANSVMLTLDNLTGAINTHEEYEASNIAGHNISSAISTLTAQDVNGDGREELVITDKATSTAYTVYASDTGMFDEILPQEAEVVKKISQTWSGFVTAMKSNNTNAVSSYFASNSKADYQNTFNELNGQLATIVNSMKNFNQVLVNDDYSIFAVNRNIDGVEQLFFIEFTLDNNGDWKITSM